MSLPPTLTKKVGPFPVWAWGVAISGGIVLGLYLRHRAKVNAGPKTSDPNAGVDALTGAATGFGMADPNAGLDNSGIISGLLQQNDDLLSLLLASAGGGGGSPPAIGDPATYEPQAGPSNTAVDAQPVAASTPSAQVGSSSAGAAPYVVTEPVVADTYFFEPDPPPPPPPPPADPAYPYSTYTPSGVIDTATATATGQPILETGAVAQGAEVMSAASSSTGGVGGTGYLLQSDKTLRPSPGVNIMM